MQQQHQKVMIRSTGWYPYAGKARKPGDVFEAREIDAFILVGSKRAVRVDSATADEDVQRSRRRYRRRDMQAEE